MNYVQLNSGLTQADVVISTPPPSGVTLFSATDAAVSPEFFYTNTPEYYSWRILLQVCDMQLHDYNEATNGDREQWKSRMLETLQRINALAEIFKPSRFPPDIKPATEESAALNASGVNWCDVMTDNLSKIFLNVQIVDTMRIEQ